MPDPIGHAISDYFYNSSPARLWIHNKYGPKEEMPVKIYFREENEMPELEHIAMELCKGTILDIGAGAGSHSILLQERGMEVTALEISALNCDVIKQRGVRKIVTQDIMLYEYGQYDTLLLLMNGIGLAQNLEGLRRFLRHAATLLKPGGSLIFDSSDIAYLYEDGVPRPDGYYGEICCRYEYKKEKSAWFNWLYVDQQTISDIAVAEEWNCTFLFKDANDQYLVEMKKITAADSE